VPNLADIAKTHYFPKKFPTVFGNTLTPKFCCFLKYQLSALTKQSILDYLPNEYPDIREKKQRNVIFVNYHSDSNFLAYLPVLYVAVKLQFNSEKMKNLEAWKLC